MEEINGTLALYDSVTHCNIVNGNNCCGIFMVVQDGVVVCNECGKSLTEVVTELNAMLIKGE